MLEAPAADLDDGRAQGAAPASFTSRQRSRLPADPRVLILASLGQKILHGWSQNRQQTLFPLTVNLRTLAPDARDLILRAMAAAMTAVAPPRRPASRSRRGSRALGRPRRIWRVWTRRLQRPSR